MKRAYQRYFNEVVKAIEEAEKTGKPIPEKHKPIYDFYKEMKRRKEGKEND